MSVSSDSLDSIFSALADPTRRAIVARLAHGESTVGELAAPFDVSLPAISKHLGVLERAGLLARERDGRMQRCRLLPQPMDQAAGWLDRYRRYWEQRLDALDHYLKESDRKEEGTSWRTRSPAPTPPSTSAVPSKRRRKKSSGRSPSPKR